MTNKTKQEFRSRILLTMRYYMMKEFTLFSVSANSIQTVSKQVNLQTNK